MKKSLFFLFVFAALLLGCSKRNPFSKSATVQNLKVGFIYNGMINDKSYVLKMRVALNWKEKASEPCMWKMFLRQKFVKKLSRNL